jgi:threonine dehydrogenase-like Zn-dependent dehydrogenase
VRLSSSLRNDAPDYSPVPFHSLIFIESNEVVPKINAYCLIDSHHFLLSGVGKIGCLAAAGLKKVGAGVVYHTRRQYIHAV